MSPPTFARRASGQPRSSIVAVLLAGAALVCSAPATAIIGGIAPDSPERRIDPNVAESPWAGVGSLTVGKGTYTATAIDRWHVITAAHVVSGKLPESIAFNLNVDSALSHRIGAAAVFVHPDYRGFKPGPTTRIVHDDLAIVRLSAPLPRHVPVYRIHSDPLSAGATITMVGYGAGGDGVSGTTVRANPAVKRVGENQADILLPNAERSGRATVFLFDFDGPDGSSNRFGGLTLGNEREASLAGGDSGSPSFVRLTAGGPWLLAGVNTFIVGLSIDTPDGPVQVRAPKFGSIGGGMLLAGYADWIATVIDQRSPDAQNRLHWIAGLGLLTAVGLRARAVRAMKRVLRARRAAE